MIRKYYNHKPQTTPWHREEKPLNHHETPGRQIKQSKAISSLFPINLLLLLRKLVQSLIHLRPKLTSTD